MKIISALRFPVQEARVRETAVAFIGNTSILNPAPLACGLVRVCPHLMCKTQFSLCQH